MSGWEEVTPNSDNPFGGVETPDGLVFAPQETSPELNWQPTVSVPAPPSRERPKPLRHERVDPWKPGPDPTPASAATSSSRVGRMLVLAVVPLLIMAGLGWLVWTFMQAYGF